MDTPLRFFERETLKENNWVSSFCKTSRKKSGWTAEYNFRQWRFEHGEILYNETFLQMETIGPQVILEVKAIKQTT